MDRIEPIGPRRDIEPVRPVVLSPREREQRKREREERKREREREERRGEAAAKGDEPPRLDIRA